MIHLMGQKPCPRVGLTLNFTNIDVSALGKTLIGLGYIGRTDTLSCPLSPWVEAVLSVRYSASEWMVPALGDKTLIGCGCIGRTDTI